MWLSIKRICRSGFVSFWRNSFVSLSAVLVMVVSLFVFLSLILTSVLLKHSLEEVKSRVDVTVNFVIGAEEADIMTLKRDLESLPEVASAEYFSPDDIFALFTERHRNDQKMIDALNELDENPFGAAIHILAKEPSQYETVSVYLEQNYPTNADDSIINDVNYEKKAIAIQKLSEIIEAGERLGAIIMITFIVIAIIITFNTIRLAMYLSRDEIKVMRLVGASTSFVSGPFVVMGAMYGITAALVTLLAFYPILYWIGPKIATIFAGFNIFSYYVSSFISILGLILGSGIVIGAFSSWLAIKRYLRENR